MSRVSPRSKTVQEQRTVNLSGENNRSYESFLRRAGRLFELDWRKYRRRGARRRLQNHLQDIGVARYNEYLELLQRDPEEAARLPDRLRVTVSRFFRERNRWLELFDRVVTPMLSGGRERPLFRAWSAGCCGGEEPYTLAMLWLDSIRPAFPAFDMEVLATDIDQEVLKRAKDGCYDRTSLREVPEQIIKNFFTRPQNRWCVRPDVKEHVKFQLHDLIRDPLPSGMDLVLCRYLVFTYYRGERRYQAALRLWKALVSGGALMIGRKEGLGPRELELFKPWPGAQGVFRKRDAGKA